MSDKIDVFENLIDRVEKEGVSTAEVDDGRIIIFTVPVLRRLLADAEASPKQKAIVFIRKAPKETA